MRMGWATSNRCSLLILLLALLLGSIACRPTAERADEVRLESIPRPDSSNLDPPSRSLLEEAWLRTQEPPSKQSVEDAARWGELGRVLHAMERWPSAEKAYRNARLLDSTEVKWTYLQGQVLLRLGLLEESAAAFEEVLALRAGHLPSMISLARARQQQGRSDLAEEVARGALQVDGESAPVHQILAELAAERAEFGAAVRSYRRVLELEPEASKVHAPLALALRALGRQAEADEHLRLRGSGAVSVEDQWLAELAELMPGAQETRLGEEAFERGDYTAAVAAFERAAALRPDDRGVTLSLGAALFRSGRSEEAAQRFRSLLESDPNSVPVRFNLGVLLASVGDPAGAEAQYREVLNLDPLHPGAQLNLANLLLRQGRAEPARPYYLSAVEADPSSSAARHGLVRCLALLGEWSEAVGVAERARKKLPESEELTVDLSRLLAAAPVEDLRDGARSLRLIEPLARRTGNAYHLESVAMALAELGRFDEAISLQERVVAAYRGAGQTVQVVRLERQLQLYRSGSACREPFAEQV